MGKFQDLSGQTIGRWQVQNIAFRKNGKIYYHCICSCDNHTEKDIQGQHLKEGRSLSCGCLRKEIMAKNKIDIAGQRFGKLTVLSEAGKTNDGKIKWLCQCDCGNQKIISGSSLRQGLTKSCGCVKSFGEKKIAEILLNNNIQFVVEKGFEECRYPDTNFQAKFDFWVEDKYLIEYDGKQHFGLGGWNDEKNFNICKSHDEYKNEWCKKNNIELIRIPYTLSLDKITLEDLQIETSKYKI